MSRYVQVQHHTYLGTHTDHKREIAMIRDMAKTLMRHTPPETATASQAGQIYLLQTAAALLEVHDDTGISLDDWIGPRELVEHALDIAGAPGTFLPNHV